MATKLEKVDVMTMPPRWVQLVALIFTVLAAGVLIGLVVGGWGSPAEPETDTDFVSEGASPATIDIPMNDRVLGEADAPVKVVEWGNYK